MASQAAIESAQVSVEVRQTAIAASGAVSVGSNPTGGAVQRQKFEYFHNLDATLPRACDLRGRGSVSDLPPDPRPGNEPPGGKRAAQRHSVITAARPLLWQRPLLFLALSQVSAATRGTSWQRRHRRGAAARSGGPAVAVERRARKRRPAPDARLAPPGNASRHSQNGASSRRPPRQQPPAEAAFAIDCLSASAANALHVCLLGGPPAAGSTDRYMPGNAKCRRQLAGFRELQRPGWHHRGRDGDGPSGSLAYRGRPRTRSAWAER